ncbi:hypothetical protein EGW08_015829 [Elysia chlorotica]|uniref:C-type lectin domain-containing protein n=1 Tax=Elysia chlorotica TaxID=188477 RepID=A0A433T481_ELYCH|nr:hypothetical protein EGW08_015829 [Elysia chlorotica]
MKESVVELKMAPETDYLEIHHLTIAEPTRVSEVNNDPRCRKGRLSAPWTAHNKISCFVQCKSLFQERCRSVIYNSHTRACTPVHPKSLDDPTPPSSPGDVLYSQDDERHLTCDTAAGFQLYSLCGAAACIMPFSTGHTYENAKAQCSAMNSVIYMANTFERYALLEAISPEYSWARVIRSGNAWQSDDGGFLEPDFSSFMWSYGQPNNFEQGSEDCAARTYAVFLDKLHDWPCSAIFRFLCEQKS